MKTGDVVRLKSGSPWMTVMQYSYSGEVRCAYWAKGAPKFEEFHLSPEVLSVMPEGCSVENTSGYPSDILF